MYFPVVMFIRIDVYELRDCLKNRRDDKLANTQRQYIVIETVSFHRKIRYDNDRYVSVYS